MKFQLLSTSLALLGASAVSAQTQLRGIQHQQLSVLLAEDYDHDGTSTSTINSGSVDLDSRLGDDTEPSESSDELYSDMFVAVSNGNSNNKGYCDGRGWNTCDRRRQACKWVGKPRSSNGYCTDRNGGGGNNRSCQNRGFNGCRNNSYYCKWEGSQRNGYCIDKNSGGGSSNFDDGLREGRQAGEKIWHDMGGDCANAWRNFKTSINREIKNRGWKTNSYNDGARKGMQEVLNKYEKKCFHDSPDEAPECIALGNEAASMIAYNFCFEPLGEELDYESYGTNCRQVAINQCKGQVYGKVRSYCGSQKSNVIDHLQNQCSMVIKVKTMIGDDAQTEELLFMED